MQRPGYLIHLPEMYLWSVSITPSQMQPEGVIFEAYLSEGRTENPMDGFLFRIVRSPAEYWASLDNGVARRLFARDERWVYTVETLADKPYDPIAVDPYTEPVPLDTILAWFIEDNGLTADGLSSVPETVLAAAERYVQKEFDFWRVNTGAYGMVDGKEQMLGTPATYDDWRVNSLTLVHTYHTLNGKPVADYQWPNGEMDWDAIAVYRLDYRLHTTTPKRVILAGGMVLEPDGWLLPTYRDSTYLVFRLQSMHVLPLYSAMINDCFPGDESFTNGLISWLTNADASYRAATALLNDLFADGATSMWYVAAGKTAPAVLPDRCVPIPQREKGRFDVQFSSAWHSVNLDYLNLPAGASLCLGDNTERYFQFYLGTDLVLWHDGERVTAWRVNDSWGNTLPDNMMGDYSGYEANEELVTIPVREGEAPEATVRRFLDAYREHLLQLAPESNHRVTDFKSLGIEVNEATGTHISIGISFAVRPPKELYHTTPWWAGNSSDGTGDLAGWLVMGRGAGFERSDGVWRCTGFYTG